jgi:hypothetical protein
MPGPSLLLLLLLLTIRALDSPRTEHDVVLLRQRGAKRAQWRLTPPLRAGQSVRLPQGASVAANALIGRRAFDVIKDDGGRDVTAHEPSLAAYVLLTQRLATPVRFHPTSLCLCLLYCKEE